MAQEEVNGTVILSAEGSDFPEDPIVIILSASGKICESCRAADLRKPVEQRSFDDVPETVVGCGQGLGLQDIQMAMGSMKTRKDG
jgi:hypothetical protein